MGLDVEKVTGWVETHKVPAAAIGGVAMAGIFAVFQAVRSGTKSASDMPNTGTYFVVPGSGGTDGFNTIPGATPPDLSSQPVYQESPVTIQPVPATMSPVSPYIAPEPTGTPLALPQVDRSRIYSTYVISNPVGSADRDAQASINPLTGFQSYTPSLSDYATEQSGGIQRSLVQTLGGPTGAAYTVDNTALGSGPVVPDTQRIPGERYDQYGRVIA